MTAVFVRVLNMSLTAGYCIAAVIVLRFLLRRQAKIFSYLLWIVVLFRLLVPFSLTSSYSLLRINPSVVLQERFADAGETAGTVWHGKGYILDETATGEGMSAVEAVPFSPLTEAGTAEQTSGWERAVLAGAWVWLAGAVALFCYSIWTVIRLRGFLSAARLAEERVFEMDGIATPFVFGVICPRIYLPAHLQPEERRYVLAHEQAHISRKDHLVKLIGWGAVCLHWFNPLVWLSFKMMESDMEMSCDETVLRRLGEDVKQDYSRVLLSLSCAESGFHASPVAFGEGGLNNRIRNILSWKRGRIATAAVLAVLLCTLAVGLMLNPTGRTQTEQTEEKLRFLDTYANAYCDRNGEVLVGLYIEEEIALESVILLEKAGGTYTMGMSSPWPNEFRYILTENLTEKEKKGEGSAEIWYYAWTSDPHVTVWKEELRFEETTEGYRVTESSFRYLDSIASREEFDEAYLIAGEYQFTDYVERGFLESIQYQTEYDRETGGEDRNALYRSPDTAAAWIFNLEGGRCETLSNVYEKQSTVEYTFADGSSVQIPMYNVRYDGTTIAAEEPEGELQVTEDIWLPDLHVWNAKAP